MNLAQYEKQIYSQAGDDGVIQHIFELIGTTNKVCVEFGEKGLKGNTKRLRDDVKWEAILFDSEPLTAASHKEFITAENIMDVFKRHKVPKEFDLLSIDIDGNDYWVWEALDEHVFKPRVAIIEFNPNFPIGDSRTIAYNPLHEYDRTIYYGASLTALQRLGRRKGYSLVHVTSYLNLFFVADDLLPELEDIKSVFPYPLNIEAVAKKWKCKPPTWYDQKAHRPRSDYLNRPWVEVYEGAKSNGKVEGKNGWTGNWRPLLHPTRSHERTILLIGNGPSTQELVDYGLENIPEDVDTFGMGAAYRYFDTIGWWPTYYGWCDTKAVVSHEAEFKRLVEDDSIPVRRFFFPYQVGHHDRLTITEHHSTGDWLFEKAIKMGYTRILMIGIEGHYIEVIPGAKRLNEVDPERDEKFRVRVDEVSKDVLLLAEHLLVMVETPEFNPNYFFEYQQEGDIFSKPNAKTGHARKWEKLLKKYSYRPDIKIVNCSPQSKLKFERGVLKDELEASNDA